MKIAIGLLIAIVLVLAWQLKAEIEVNRLQQNQIAELSSKLSDRTIRDNVELQDKCAQQAEKMFRQLGWEDKGQSSGFTAAAYQSHYNAKVNKCFMSVDSSSASSGKFFTNGVLIDAYEQRTYAEIDRMFGKGNDKDKKGPPDELLMTCMLIPSSAKQSPCKSQEEYKAFVASYME